MDYIHWAVLLVTLTQIIIVSAYVWLDSRLRRTQKEMDTAYEAYELLLKTYRLTYQHVREQDLKVALLLRMQGIEIEGFEVATSPEDAISMIFESMGESADDLKPEDFN